MRRWGQAPRWNWSGETPGVTLDDLIARFAPDGGGQGDGGSGGTGDGGSGGSAGGQGAGTGAGGGTELGADGQPFDAARAQRTIAALREEIKASKGTAAELETLRAKLKEIEDKDKTDSQRLAGDLDSTTKKLTAAEQKAADLEAKYTTTVIRSAIDRAAHKLGAADADDVFALLAGKIGSEIKLDESGAVAGAEKAVEALLKAKPYLVSGNGGNGSGIKATPGTPPGAGSASDEERVKARAEQQRKSGFMPGF